MVHSMSILTWSWNIKFQTLPVEHLVVIESWRCFIEANVFARKDLVISGTALRGPLCSRVFEVVLYLISRSAEILGAFQDLLSIVFVERMHFTFDIRVFDS